MVRGLCHSSCSSSPHPLPPELCSQACRRAAVWKGTTSVSVYFHQVTLSWRLGEGSLVSEQCGIHSGLGLWLVSVLPFVTTSL